MLEMRPTCENCERALPPSALDARICTFECTFCAACADGPLGGVCPNCSGELVARPVRPAALADGFPAADPVHSEVDLAAHRARLRERGPGRDHAGVALHAYADAWRSGDLERLIACYADDFTLHYSGTSRFAGTHVGKDAALETMAAVSTVAPRELIDVEEVLVADRGGALVVKERLTRDGESVDLQRVLRYRVADGLLVECWLHESDQGTVDHFWR